MTAVLSSVPDDSDGEIRGHLSHRKSRYDMVPVDKLEIDYTVQQPLREGKVRHILKSNGGFDLAAAGVIVVSLRRRGNTVQYIVLDGQHRAEAAHRSGVTKLHATVWEDLTHAEESWLFVHLNDKSNPTAVSVFNGRANSGDGIPARIRDTLVGHGWKVSDQKTSSGQFAAVGAAERIFTGAGMFKCNRPGEQVFSRVIETVTTAWGMNKTATDAGVIQGLALFLIRYWDDIDQDKLIDALRKVTPEQLRAAAKLVQSTMGAHPVSAHGLKFHQEYNKRTRIAKLPAFAL